MADARNMSTRARITIPPKGMVSSFVFGYIFFTLRVRPAKLINPHSALAI
jgi:hypothetical protein